MFLISKWWVKTWWWGSWLQRRRRALDPMVFGPRSLSVNVALLKSRSMNLTSLDRFQVAKFPWWSISMAAYRIYIFTVKWKRQSYSRGMSLLCGYWMMKVLTSVIQPFENLDIWLKLYSVYLTISLPLPMLILLLCRKVIGVMRYSSHGYRVHRSSHVAGPILKNYPSQLMINVVRYNMLCSRLTFDTFMILSLRPDVTCQPSHVWCIVNLFGKINVDKVLAWPW